VLRSLHEATGVSIWISTFVLAYLARLGGSSGHGVREPRVAPEPDDLVGAGTVRAPSVRGAFSSAVLEGPPIIETKEPWQNEATAEVAPAAVEPAVVEAPQIVIEVPKAKPHSVAVIIARGADL
jgi:hypothetical protein